MTATKTKAPPRDELDELGFQFFKLISQCESRLKELGYVRRSTRGRIEVEWERFLLEMGDAIFRTMPERTTASIDYILNNPAMKQSLDYTGCLIWEPTGKPGRSMESVIRQICRTRDNLFHSRELNGTTNDPNQRAMLMENGAVILAYLLESLERVGQLGVKPR